MRRLICAFVVCIWHKQVFSWCGSFLRYWEVTSSPVCFHVTGPYARQDWSILGRRWHGTSTTSHLKVNPECLRRNRRRWWSCWDVVAAFWHSCVMILCIKFMWVVWWVPLKYFGIYFLHTLLEFPLYILHRDVWNIVITFIFLMSVCRHFMPDAVEQIRRVFDDNWRIPKGRGTYCVWCGSCWRRHWHWRQHDTFLFARYLMNRWVDFN